MLSCIGFISLCPSSDPHTSMHIVPSATDIARALSYVVCPQPCYDLLCSHCPLSVLCLGLALSHRVYTRPICYDFVEGSASLEYLVVLGLVVDWLSTASGPLSLGLVIMTISRKIDAHSKQLLDNPRIGFNRHPLYLQYLSWRVERHCYSKGS